jgi:hypothetical protein
MAYDTLYPVLQEMNLPAVPSKLIGRVRRDLNELPQSPPGTALVFQVDGQYHVYDERRRLTGNEDFVTEALAVSVVNLRPHRFTTDLTVPSKHPSESFTIRVAFESVVNRPEQVTRLGSVSLPELLADHLRQDREVVEICVKRGIEDVALVRNMIDARIAAFYRNRPLYQPGIEVTLKFVDVLTPIGLAERDRAELTTRYSHNAQMRENELSHKRRLQTTGHDQEHEFRSTEWERRQRHREDQLELEHDAEIDRMRQHMERRAEELEWEYRTKVEQMEEQQRKSMIELSHKTRMTELELTREQTEQLHLGEDATAARMRKHYEAGIPGLLALSAAQGLITPLEMVAMLRDDEAKSLEQIRSLINGLIGEGRGDLVSVDLQTMVDTLQEKLLGRLVDRPEHALTRAGAGAQEITSRDEREDGDETPPDEDEFN